MKSFFAFLTIFTISLSSYGIPAAEFQLMSSKEDQGEESPMSLNESLNTIYEALYNIDYRVLSIEDFLTYNQSLQSLKELAETPHCSPQETKPEILVYESSYNVTNPWDQCNYLGEETFEHYRVVFTEDSIRDCYKEGFFDCKVKEQARVKSYQGFGSGHGAGCKITYDIVLQGKK